MTVSCPLDCEYLVEARNHERPAEIDPKAIPNMDIEITEEFLRKHEQLLIVLATQLLNSTLATPGAVDTDIREALEAMVKTYRTRKSGLIYESRPENPIAGQIQQRLQATIEEMEQRMKQQNPMAGFRDSDLLGILAFLQRFEMQWTNGRPRGRSFISFLMANYGRPAQHAETQPTLVI